MAGNNAHEQNQTQLCCRAGNSAGGFTKCPDHVLCYLTISCARSRSGAVAVPSLLPRLGWAQAAPSGAPTMERQGPGAERSTMGHGWAVPHQPGPRPTVPEGDAGRAREWQWRPAKHPGHRSLPSAPRPSQAGSASVAAVVAAVQRCPAMATVTSRAKRQGPGLEQRVRVQARAWLRLSHRAACSLSSRSPAEGDSPRCQHQPPSPGRAGGTPAGPRRPTERGSPTAHRHGIGGACCEAPWS